MTNKEILNLIIELRTEISSLRWIVYHHIAKRKWFPDERTEYLEELAEFEETTDVLLEKTLNK